MFITLHTESGTRVVNTTTVVQLYVEEGIGGPDALVLDLGYSQIVLEYVTKEVVAARLNFYRGVLGGAER